MAGLKTVKNVKVDCRVSFRVRVCGTVPRFGSQKRTTKKGPSGVTMIKATDFGESREDEKPRLFTILMK